MTDSFPIVLAALIAILSFIIASKWGVVRQLSSGVAAAAAFAVLAVGFGWLPELAKNYFDMDLAWKSIAAIVGGVAVFVFVLVRIVGGLILKRIMGPGGWFHALADGTPGGIVSLFPSIVVILFLFTCVRVAGTLHELHYTASLSRDGIAHMAEKIPRYPVSGRWRGSVEMLPGVAPLLDLLDPFSNRRNRNVAALVTASDSSLIRAYFLSQPDTADLAAAPEIIELIRVPDIYRAVEKESRVDLVMNPAIHEVASDPDLAPLLKKMKLRPILEGYVASLKPVVPDTVN